MEMSFGCKAITDRENGTMQVRAVAVDEDGNAYITGNHTAATGLGVRYA